MNDESIRQLAKFMAFCYYKGIAIKKVKVKTMHCRARWSRAKSKQNYRKWLFTARFFSNISIDTEDISRYLSYCYFRGKSKNMIFKSKVIREKYIKDSGDKKAYRYLAMAELAVE